MSAVTPTEAAASGRWDDSTMPTATNASGRWDDCTKHWDLGDDEAGWENDFLPDAIAPEMTTEAAAVLSKNNTEHYKQILIASSLRNPNMVSFSNLSVARSEHNSENELFGTATVGACSEPDQMEVTCY